MEELVNERVALLFAVMNVNNSNLAQINYSQLQNNSSAQVQSAQTLSQLLNKQ